MSTAPPVTVDVGTLELRGGGGEPVDFRRTLASHGVAALAPHRVDDQRSVLETTLRAGGTARTVSARVDVAGRLRVSLVDGRRAGRAGPRLLAAVRHILSLDEDLSGFYAIAASDPMLSWAAQGAGRMMRSPTVFEDVVKTICTTNCAWSATVRMTDALVHALGDAAPDGRRAFPTPAAMAEAGPGFYREVARAGYRGDYLLRLARDEADGRLGLEALRDRATSDADVEAALLALPGVGPYGAAHIMLTSLGRYRRLVFDSWTRPTYAALHGRAASDKTIERRFRRYGRYAGLAFWLFLTRGWVSDPASDLTGYPATDSG
jgi:3-methyladenine DNA glycosylase/8-oxoguanine DNA glycosylase